MQILDTDLKIEIFHLANNLSMKKALLIPAWFLSFVCYSQNHISLGVYINKINPYLLSNGLLSKDISNSQNLVPSYNTSRLWLLNLSHNSNENSIMIDHFTSPFNTIDDYNETLSDLKPLLK